MNKYGPTRVRQSPPIWWQDLFHFGQKHSVSVEEAQTMQAIRRAFPDNEIPVPELVGGRSVGSTNFIYMCLVKGATLESSWPTLTHEEKSTIAGSISGTKVQDIYFRADAGAGPFSTVKDFNDRLQIRAWHWLPVEKRPFDPHRTLLLDTYRICFSHADLHLDNVMISGDAGWRSVVAVVDWAMSGWYPEYWEYCKMMLGVDHLPFYDEVWLPTVLEIYDSEYDAFVNYWQYVLP